VVKELGIIEKRDLEFEIELAMALSATAVEAQGKVNNENSVACKERYDTTHLDVPTSRKKSSVYTQQNDDYEWDCRSRMVKPLQNVLEPL
jgi:hypothetical protein